mmetsp:Transcript_45732/g.111481  ORF Transcript_45732/g.111481 Transcript_45732/m.111481 type:complete len:307 (-) Transcript_45732:731-1651(-)
MYPPEAATCSTAIVNLRPLSFRRTNCPAARPYPVTVPPPDCRTTRASSPGFALRTIAVTSSRSSFSCDAWTSPGKFITNNLLFPLTLSPSLLLFPAFKITESGRSSSCTSRLPVPRTWISPNNAFRRPNPRLVPTAAMTCSMNVNSSFFSFFCESVIFVNNSSCFFFCGDDFERNESDDVSLAVLASAVTLEFPSTISASTTEADEDPALSFFSSWADNLDNAPSIAKVANSDSYFWISWTSSFPIFKNARSAASSFAFVAPDNVASFPVPSPGSAFNAKFNARSKDCRRKTDAACALLVVARRTE